MKIAIRNYIKKILIIMGIGIFVFYVFLYMPVDGCEFKKVMDNSKKYWVVAQYSLYYFQNNENIANPSHEKAFLEFSEKWTKSANIFVKKIDDVSERNSLYKKYKLSGNLSFIVVSPHGKIIWSLETDEKIQGNLFDLLIASPYKLEIIQSLKKYDVITLCIVERTDKDRKNILARLRSSVKLAEELFKISIKIIELDPNNLGEKYFLKNLGFSPLNTESSISLIFGKGKAIPLLNKDFTEEQFLDKIQNINRMCTCLINPYAFGEDLLLPRNKE